MPKWHLGVEGRHTLLDDVLRRPSWFQQLWCTMDIPLVRWFENAYVWIGISTDSNDFMQIGVFPQEENSAVDNALYYGETQVFYATSRKSYGLIADNRMRLRPGDKLLLNIQRYTPDDDMVLWMMGATNMSTNKTVISDMIPDSGYKFHISTLKIVFEGYRYTTIVPPGDLAINDIGVKDLSGVVHTPRLRHYSSKGRRDAFGVPMSSPPSDLKCTIEDNGVVFTYSSP